MPFGNSEVKCVHRPNFFMTKNSPLLAWFRRHLRVPVTSLLIACFSFWTVQAQAGTLYWDSDASVLNNNVNTGAGLGGAGAWDTVTSNWFPAGGVANQAWNNAGNDTAVFLGGAGTVNLVAPITVGGLSFNTTGYTITGGTLAFGAATNRIVLNNVAGAEIDSAISGSTPLVVSGGIYGGATAGTLTLTGSGPAFTGSTTIGNGMTVTLSGPTGTALSNTAAVNLNNGNLTLINANGTEGALVRVNSSAPITVNGNSAITYTNTASATDSYAQTLGALVLASGQLTVTSTNGALSPSTQVLTFTGNLSHSPGNTSTIAFIGGTSLGVDATNQMLFTTQGTTAAGAIIGAWATAGAGTTATDYAVYGANGITGLGAAAVTSDATWNTALANNSTGNINLNNGTTTTTLSSNKALNTLLYTGGSATLALGTFNLNTSGILQGGTGLLTITSGGGGLSTPTGAADNLLYITTGAAQNITISAPIMDNGTNSVTLVKSGTSTLTLTTAAASNWSGGTVINAGKLSLAADAGLGTVLSSGITFNGSSSLVLTGASTLNAYRTITLNNGSLVTIVTSNQPQIINGTITGTGGLIVDNGNTVTLGALNNDFQGAIRVGVTAATTLSVASLVDSATANGAIRLGGGTFLGTFSLGTGATTSLALNNRQFDLAGTTGGGTIDNSNTGAANIITVNTPLLISGSGTKTLTLSGANIGANTFATTIFDGTGGATALTHSGAGTWILTASNAYTGNTTLSATGITGFSSDTAFSTSTVTVSGAGVLMPLGGARTLANNVILTAAPMVLGTQNLTLNGTLTNSGGNQTLINALSGATTLTVGNIFLSELSGTGRTLTLSGPGATVIGGVIADFNGAGAAGNLTYAGTGTLTLNGTNTYSGTSTLNGSGGTVILGNSSALGTGPITLGAPVNLQGSSTLTLINNIALTGSPTISGTNGFTLTGNFTNTGGNNTLTNSLSSAPLTIAGNVYLSDLPGTGRTLTLAGASPTTISGIIADFNGSGISGGLTYTGSNTLTLTGVNAYTGTTTVKSGSLVVDLSLNPAGVLATASSLTLTAGSFILRGQTGAGTSGQTIAGLTISPNSLGTINIDPNNGGGTTLTLGTAWTRGTSSTLLINYFSGNTGTPHVAVSGTPTGSGAPANNGILGYALVTDVSGVTGMAQINGGNIVRFDSTTASPLTTTSNDGTVDFTTIGLTGTTVGSPLAWNTDPTPFNRSVNSLTIDTSVTGAQFINMGIAANVLTVTPGGAIQFLGSSPATLSGGQVGASNAELIIHQLGTGTLTLASQLSGGTGRLLMDGTGTIALTNANNTFTGGVIINGGTLQIGSAGALGTPQAPSATLIRWFGPVISQQMTGTNVITFGPGSTGTLSLNGFNTTITGLSTNTLVPGSATVQNASATPAMLTVSPLLGTTTTYAGILQDGAGGGSLGLTKVGDGSLTLGSSSNTYTGSTIINAGTVTIAGAGSLGSSSSPVIVNGVAGLGFTGGTLVLGGAVTPINFSRSLIIAGRGTNNASGAALVSVGSNTISGSLTGGFGSTESRFWQAAGTSTITGTVAPSGGNFYFGGDGNVIISGLVTGSVTGSGLNKNSLGGVTSTLVLTNINNNFATDVQISAGTLRVSNGGALGNSISASALSLQGGILEIRSDVAATFANRNVGLVVSGPSVGSLFVSRDVAGSGLNQTFAFGNFASVSNAGQTLTLGGRDGDSISFASGTTTPVVGGSMALTNSTNGLVTFNGNVQWTDTTARTYTFQGNAETLMNGNLLETGTLAHVYAKAGQGTLTLQGTTGNFLGSFNLSGGTLAINAFSSINAGLGGALQLNAGALNYLGNAVTGAGEAVTKSINLTGTTGAGIILANQSLASPGPLSLLNSIAATGASSKSLFLGGSSTSSVVNQVLGVIQDNSAANITSLVKVGTNTWQYSPSPSTYVTTAATGVTVASGGAAQTNNFVVSSTTGLVVGETVSGTNVPAGSIITAISGTTVFINNAIATALTASTALTFGTIGPVGAAESFTGSVSVEGGTLQIKPAAATGNGANLFTTAQALVFNNDLLRSVAATSTFAGGTFELVTPSVALTANLSQTMGLLTPTAGAGKIQVDSGSGGFSNILSFNGYTTRGAGATVNFAPAATLAGIQFAVVPTAVLNGVVSGAYITNPTTGAIDFVATPTINTPIAALGSVTALPAVTGSSTTNYVNTSGLTLTGATAANTVRIVGGGQTINQAGFPLTITNTAVSTIGGILFDNSGGAATIAGGNIAGSVAANELIFIVGGSNQANALTVNSTIGAGSASAVTKAGSGTLIIGGNNTFTGNLTINEGTVRMSSAIGIPALGVITTATNVTTIRQGATLDINGAGAPTQLYPGATNMNLLTIGALTGAGLVTNSGTASAISIGSSLSTAGGVFNGILQDGAGALTVVRNGASGSVALTGLNTYTGATILSGGATLQANTLANIGLPSSIGAGNATNSTTNAASLVFNGGTLQYQGANATVYATTQTPSISINRLFTLAGNGSIDSTGTYGNQQVGTTTGNQAALIFNNTSPVVFSGVGGRVLTLTGSSTGDNELDLQLIDNPNGGQLAVTKASTGLWILGNNASNYSGATTISGGQLRVTANAGNLSPNSNLVFNGGVLETSGTYSASIGLGAGQVQWNTNASGGFAASSAPLTVNLGGAGATLVWGLGGIGNGTGGLILSSSTAQFDVNFVNPMDLNGGNRTVTINDNSSTAMDFATLSGVIKGGGAGSQLTLIPNAPVYLTGANTYAGNTNLNAGAAVFVTSIGAAGVTSSAFGTNSGGALNLGSGTSNAYVVYYGPGETTTRTINISGTTTGGTIESSGTGPLILTTVNTTGSGAKALTLRGSNTDPNEITGNLADLGGALTIAKADGGVWILSGANTNTGGVSISGGSLGVRGTTSGTSGTNLGTGTVTFSNAALFALNSAGFTMSNPVTIASNTQASFSGSNSITLNGNITGASGNPWTINNSILSPGVLTIGGNFANADGTTSGRALNFTGTGTTTYNGIIANNNSATFLTALSVNTSGTVTLNGANTY